MKYKQALRRSCKTCKYSNKIVYSTTSIAYYSCGRKLQGLLLSNNGNCGYYVNKFTEY